MEPGRDEKGPGRAGWDALDSRHSVSWSPRSWLKQTISSGIISRVGVDPRLCSARDLGSNLPGARASVHCHFSGLAEVSGGNRHRCSPREGALAMPTRETLPESWLLATRALQAGLCEPCAFPLQAAHLHALPCSTPGPDAASPGPQRHTPSCCAVETAPQFTSFTLGLGAAQPVVL